MTMKSSAAVILSVLSLMFMRASVGPANAQALKTWRHGVVEAKSDAGFAFMAAQRGFAEKQG